MYRVDIVGTDVGLYKRVANRCVWIAVQLYQVGAQQIKYVEVAM